VWSVGQVHFYQTTRRNIPEKSALGGHRRESLKQGLRTESYDEELHSLNHSANNIVKTIQSIALTWMRHVARIGDIRNKYRNFVLKI
jgi:hypothetical protein